MRLPSFHVLTTVASTPHAADVEWFSSCVPLHVRRRAMRSSELRFRSGVTQPALEEPLARIRLRVITHEIVRDGTATAGGHLAKYAADSFADSLCR